MNARLISRSLATLALCSCISAPAFSQAKPGATVMKAAPAAGAPVGKPGNPAVPSSAVQAPDSATLLILIRSALETLNQANATNNYSVLYGMGSPTFQKANPIPALESNFAQFRQNRISLYPALVLAPRLQQNPMFDGTRLRMVGAVPSRPLNITFDIQYERIDNVWKLSIISVGMAQPAQTPAKN